MYTPLEYILQGRHRTTQVLVGYTLQKMRPCSIWGTCMGMESNTDSQKEHTRAHTQVHTRAHTQVHTRAHTQVHTPGRMEGSHIRISHNVHTSKDRVFYI